ncbi:hypothetical protein TrVE_jg11037 [Triparma verrucosa]|uniref:Protein farnesyltransferase/geranylgeranyltransferase type-1 subunit alpha n=1 Tax=Triparma verrucosa TaxID=1606542 RepID=A0A9W7KVW4_9STRA|nr:hypothetical protein TrVE_jg11037 [Triparma verrucosa]
MDLPTVFPDLTPTPQDDGPSPICAIQYSPNFTEIMSYFRTLLKTQELSSRALQLTALVVEENAANYTAWWYRRKCLKSLNSDLGPELIFTSEIGGSNPKNYQIWYHRRALLSDLLGGKDDAKYELKYVDAVLRDDCKNYHAWSHRQYIVRSFGVWEGEKEWVEGVVGRDGRNNSGWSYRWFVVFGEGGEVDLKSEVTYTLNQCTLDPHNESPFKYLTGLLKLSSASPDKFVNVEGRMEECLEKCKGWDSVHAKCFVVDFDEDEEVKKRVCRELMEEDKVRRKYWEGRLAKI